MKIVYIIDEDDQLIGFMNRQNYDYMLDRFTDYAKDKIAFELDLPDGTTFEQCRAIQDCWRDNFELIGTDVNKLYKIMVFK